MGQQQHATETKNRSDSHCLQIQLIVVFSESSLVIRDHFLVNLFPILGFMVLVYVIVSYH